MEEWRDIENFPGYQVSSEGRVRTFWVKKHYQTGYGTYRCLSGQPNIMSQSDDGNGYLKVTLYCREDGKRYCKKVHKLVADAFIPNDDPSKNTVDHIKPGREGKLDNSVGNLRWFTRRENIQKAYQEGMCDDRIERSKKDIVLVDEWTGESCYFSSIREASDMTGINYTTIVHALKKNSVVGNRYLFEYAEGEDRMLYGDDDNKLLSWLRVGIR